MNPRIRELVKQAGGHFSTRNLMSNPVQQIESVELWDDKIEKFAELFIKECVDKMEGEDSFYGGWMGRVIKEHFGVQP